MVREEKMKNLTLKSKCRSHTKENWYSSSFHSSYIQVYPLIWRAVKYFQCSGLSRGVYEIHKETKNKAHWNSMAMLCLPQRTEEDFRKKIIPQSE